MLDAWRAMRTVVARQMMRHRATRVDRVPERTYPLQCRAMNAPAERLNRTALIAAVAGIACLIGSCAPLGTAAWRTWQGNPPRVLPLSAAAPLRDFALDVEPGRHARIALVVSLQAAGQPAIKGSRAVPAALRVRDTQGRVLLEEMRDTDASSARDAQVRIAKAGDGQLTLHFDFAKFMAPADGHILIDASLAAEREDGAALKKSELTVNDGIGDYAVGVSFGVFMLLAGWIAAVVGVLNLLGNPTPPLAPPLLSAQERGAAMRAHLCGLLAYPLPLVHLLVMASTWVRGRKGSAFVEEHGREALNFQLSILVYLLIAFSLSLVLIGLLMLPLVLLFQLVMMIEAAVQARAGHRFRYPLTFRFLRAP